MHLFKDAMSVYLYPYSRSQIFKHVKYTKYVNITKEIAKFCDKSGVFGQKKESTTTTKQETTT